MIDSLYTQAMDLFIGLPFKAFTTGNLFGDKISWKYDRARLWGSEGVKPISNP